MPEAITANDNLFLSNEKYAATMMGAVPRYQVSEEEIETSSTHAEISSQDDLQIELLETFTRAAEQHYGNDNLEFTLEGTMDSLGTMGVVNEVSFEESAYVGVYSSDDLSIDINEDDISLEVVIIAEDEAIIGLIEDKMLDAHAFSNDIMSISLGRKLYIRAPHRADWVRTWIHRIVKEVGDE